MLSTNEAKGPTPEPVWNVLNIVRGTTVDGPGFRTSVYLAGCAHGCPECHNPQSWNPAGGCQMTLPEILAVVREEDFDVTLTGGDPLFNPVSSRRLVEALKDEGRNVWVFTGFTWETICLKTVLLDAVRNADVVVDGPFVKQLHDPDLLFIGSSNQRLIDVKASLSADAVRLWNPS